MEKNPGKTKIYEDGIGVPEESLKGVGMRDAQKAEVKRIEKPEKEKKSSYVTDVVSSLVNGVSNVPDSLATSIMVGVNPVYGLYATIIAPTVGGLVSSSQLMMVGVTVASALLGGQAGMSTHY